MSLLLLLFLPLLMEKGEEGDLLLFFPEAKGREGTFFPTSSSSSSSSSFLSERGWKGRNLLLLCPDGKGIEGTSPSSILGESEGKGASSSVLREREGNEPPPPLHPPS